MADEAREARREMLERAREVADVLDSLQIADVEDDSWPEVLDRVDETMQSLTDAESQLYAAVLDERSGKGRIREYLKRNQGETVTTESLARISGIKEFARRLRELRNEEGFIIDSTRTRADLGSHEYELVEIRDTEDKSRVDPSAREAYLDEHPACERCGFDPSEHNHVAGEKRYLEVDHVEPYVDFDDPERVNRAENLQTLCNKCHTAKTTADDVANRRGRD